LVTIVLLVQIPDFHYLIAIQAMYLHSGSSEDNVNFTRG